MAKRKRPPWWPEGDSTCPSPDMEEFDALPWPERAPFLTADDLAVESSDDGVDRPGRGGKRFTLGDWVVLSFPRSTCAAAVIEAVLNCLSAKLKRPLHYHHMSEMPRGGTLRTLAAAWNEVLRVLGYEPDVAPGAQPAEDAAQEPVPPADSLQDIMAFGRQLSCAADVSNKAAARKRPRGGAK